MVYVPIMKWAGLDYKNIVIPLGLLLNGLNTLLALIPYHRAKLVDYRGAWTMGIAAVIFAPLGAITTKYVPKDFLIILFALFVLAAALKVLWDVRKSARKAAAQVAVTAEVGIGTVGSIGHSDGKISSGVGSQDEEMMPLQKRMVWGTVIGVLVGFIGGLLGVGGGFIIGPVLMAMGYSTKKAAATTAFVVTFSSFSGYFGHMAGGEAFNGLTLLLILAVVIGSQLGANFMAKKAKGNWVKLTYGIVLLLISVKLVFDVVL